MSVKDNSDPMTFEQAIAAMEAKCGGKYYDDWVFWRESWPDNGPSDAKCVMYHRNGEWKVHRGPFLDDNKTPDPGTYLTDEDRNATDWTY